jgi:hypothetical protein
MHSLIHCIYASRKTSSFNEHEIPVLLEKARAANAGKAITGMLLYVEGSFFQVLEGDPQSVDEVYAVIQRDPRHKDVSMIIREPITERGFADWTMGFSTVGRDELGKLLGENDFFASATCLAELTGVRAKKLLASFRSGRWRADETGAHQVRSRMA